MNGSARDGFEEFVCQLARREDILCTCYWILEDGSEVAWQAKYFCKAFGDSQYQQIDGSVKEALNTHPNLRRYIIAVPTDPSDAHITSRMSMKERIDGYVERWSELNSHVAFEFWWASDLIERIQKPQNQGMIRFWFGGHEFTDEDFVRFNAVSIKDLGKRYTPELNVEVRAADYFEVLSRGKSLARYFNVELNRAEEACKKIEKNKYCDGVLDKIENVRKATRQINEINITGIDELSLESFLNSLSALAEAVQDIANKVVDKEKNTYDRVSRKLYDYAVDVLNVYNDLHQDIMKLINDPILILEGDAGVGKSHLIADVVQRREKEKQFSLLFLGQKFVSDEDPFTQMMNMLYFKGSSEELLEMLEAKAEGTRHRIIIFIDAINEGHGLTIWPNNIRSFIDKIRQHP